MGFIYERWQESERQTFSGHKVVFFVFFFGSIKWQKIVTANGTLMNIAKWIVVYNPQHRLWWDMLHIPKQYDIYWYLGFQEIQVPYVFGALRHCVLFLVPLCGIAKLPVSSIHSVFVRFVFAPFCSFLHHLYIYIYLFMGVSINGDTPKWMVYKGKSH